MIEHLGLRFHLTKLALLVALGTAGSHIGAAQAAETYPDRPVKIVVGMPAGTFTDTSARLIGDSLSNALHEKFVIENRPGAATNIATSAVARSTNDGYTLLLSTNSNAMNVSLFKELPFNIEHDFVPVAMIASTNFVLVVRSTLPINSVQELIAYAKAHPGTLNFASTGKGTANHLAVEMLSKQAGVKVATIFYKGSVEALTDLIAGRTDAMFAPPSTAMPHVEAGKLRALAMTGSERSPTMPKLPTVAEAGLPGYEVAMWNGLFAPAGTPPAVVAKLAKAATDAVASEEMQKKIRAGGGDPVVMGPKEFTAYLQKDIKRWSDVIHDAGIQPQ